MSILKIEFIIYLFPSISSMNLDLKINHFGSPDSQDIDVFVLIGEEVVSPMKHHIAVNLCKSYTKRVASQLSVDEDLLDVNLCKVKDGVMVWCAKGYSDESNNALLATYDKHQQRHPCFVTRKMDRVLDYKIHRAIRCFLGSLDRSQYRADIQLILKANKNLGQRILLVESLDLLNLNWSKTINVADKMKKAVVQILQCLALFSGKELFSKQELRDYYPCMTPFIDRKSPKLEDYTALHELIIVFIKNIKLLYPNLLDKCEIEASQ